MLIQCFLYDHDDGKHSIHSLYIHSFHASCQQIETQIKAEQRVGDPGSAEKG